MTSLGPITIGNFVILRTGEGGFWIEEQRVYEN